MANDLFSRLPKGIYGLTAAFISRGRDNVSVVREMIAGGVAVLQYREKHGQTSFRQMLEECLAIRQITREARVPLIINDYVELAMMVDADGVHLGQDDLPVAQVRERVGNKIIGLSTHSPEQAEAAVAAGVDYIGLGPIFPTQTKEGAGAPLGLDRLSQVTSRIPLPVAAIGGVTLDNVEQVGAAGAHCACLVSEIVGAADIAARVRELQRRFLGSDRNRHPL